MMQAGRVTVFSRVREGAFVLSNEDLADFSEGVYSGSFTRASFRLEWLAQI